MKKLLFLAVLLLGLVACDDKEDITNATSTTDPAYPYTQLAGSISGSYLIQGELSCGDRKFELKAEDQIGLMPPAIYCVFNYHDPKTTVRYSCMLSIDDKMYTLTVPPFEVYGELWHVHFNTETAAKLYEGEKQIAEGAFTLVGRMDLISTPLAYPMDYDCDLEFQFECELGSYQMYISKLLSRNRE